MMEAKSDTPDGPPPVGAPSIQFQATPAPLPPQTQFPFQPQPGPFQPQMAPFDQYAVPQQQQFGMGYPAPNPMGGNQFVMSQGGVTVGSAYGPGYGPGYGPTPAFAKCFMVIWFIAFFAIVICFVAFFVFMFTSLASESGRL